ncbi:Puf family RNA-binding protein [Trachipleistophora hominis]|uniref:Puf family RNA-binding protein n=1 Tax=Trachipleistophora hominis TaxID=72359 RepID=L7JZR1_TRAHO|nr:Puf family RNA-binding protein [Trachipleistophora hominis]
MFIMWCYKNNFIKFLSPMANMDAMEGRTCYKKTRLRDKSADSKKVKRVDGENSNNNSTFSKNTAGVQLSRNKERNTKYEIRGKTKHNENDLKRSNRKRHADEDNQEDNDPYNKSPGISKSIQKSKTNEMIDLCKKDWEISRKKKVPKINREDANTRIYKTLKGHFYKVLKKRTGSKIAQTLFKYGSATLKDQIFEEIYKHIPELCQCSFSIFFLQKLLNTKYLAKVFELMKKNYRKILTSRVGAFYFDEVYQHVNVAQKEEIIKEIMGNEVKIFYGGKPLQEIPSEKFNFEVILDKLMNKGLTNLEITHDLIFYHLMHYTDTNERASFMKTLSSFFVDLLHTERGKSIAHQLLKENENHKILFKKTGEYIARMVENVFVHDILLEMIRHGKEKYVSKYILKPLRTSMDVFLNTNNFDHLLLELINMHKFEILRDKFTKTYKRNEEIYALKYEKVFKKLKDYDVEEKICIEDS